MINNRYTDYNIDPQFVVEAAGGIRVINVDDEPMKIKLITDNIIKLNGLKCVNNPIMFERGDVPTVDGLFSEYIFGTTSAEIIRTYAYIDLQRKFIHPYVYEILKKIFRNVERICAGESSWTIQEDGKLKEIKEDDPLYNEDNTGLEWFIQNYHSIKFEPNESLGRIEKLKFINSLSDDELFISKWIVIPLFYRDIDKTSGLGARKIPDINYDYNNLIKYTNAISKDVLGLNSTYAMFTIQTILVKIRKYGQQLIESKSGAFHQMVLGKSIDYGSRVVISVPSMNYYETPNEAPIDMLHTGIPLARCIIIGYPFMIKWILEYFDQEFSDKHRKKVYKRNPDTNKLELLEEVQLDDQSSIFTEDYIKKKMKDFINTYGGRFEPIKVKLTDGRETYLQFPGRGYSLKLNKPTEARIVNRPLTWTDIFYMAAVETLSDKHVYITRYPLVNQNNRPALNSLNCGNLSLGHNY